MLDLNARLCWMKHLPVWGLLFSGSVVFAGPCTGDFNSDGRVPSWTLRTIWPCPPLIRHTQAWMLTATWWLRPMISHVSGRSSRPLEPRFLRLRPTVILVLVLCDKCLLMRPRRPTRWCVFDGAYFQGGEENVIRLASGTQLTIPGTAGEIFVDASMVPSNIVVDANSGWIETCIEPVGRRVLVIEPGCVAALHGLTITGGIAPGSFYSVPQPGGGILNHGTLKLISCSVERNRTKDGCGCQEYVLPEGSGVDGAPGGGIYSTGPLVLDGLPDPYEPSRVRRERMY